jgi:hypothetical protein
MRLRDPRLSAAAGRLDLAGVVVTADALQTHPEAAWVPGRRKAGPLPVSGQGQPPTLLARCTGLPRHRVPVLDRTRGRGHGRIQVRIRKPVDVCRFGFSHPPRSSGSPASAPSAAHRPAADVGGGRP